MNLFTLLDQTAKRLPDHGAVYLGTNQLQTFAELRARALQIAFAIRSQYESGTRIAVVSENRPEYVELLFGIWAAGMIATPINAKLHPKEMMQIVKDGSVALTFVSAKLSGDFDRGVADAGLSCERIVIAGQDYSALFSFQLGCCRFRRHRVRCFEGTGSRPFPYFTYLKDIRSPLALSSQ